MRSDEFGMAAAAEKHERVLAELAVRPPAMAAAAAAVV
jgi:hypothetical protein